MYHLERKYSLREMPSLESDQWLEWANGPFFTDSLNPQRGLLLPWVPRGIFLAHAFTSEVTDGVMNPSTKHKVELLLARSRASGFLVHCSLEREAWGKKTMLPEVLTRIDYREIEKASVLVAFPQTSQGVCIEIGWAGAMGKEICICWDLNKDTSIDLNGVLERLYCLGGIIPDLVLYDGRESAPFMVERVVSRVKERLV